MSWKVLCPLFYHEVGCKTSILISLLFLNDFSANGIEVREDEKLDDSELRAIREQMQRLTAHL
jgi:hypothetical protein